MPVENFSAMTHPKETKELDPRVRRSRQMLHEALGSLLRTKPFEEISIQDIAEESSLNRATFYSHYPDKYTLLQCMIGSRFQELMAKRDVKLGSCQGALKALALATCDFLRETSGAMCSSKAQLDGSLQSAVIAVLQAILDEGLTHRSLNGTVSAKLLTSTLAWAIFGAANTWAQTPEKYSAEQMAELIDRLVSPVLHLAVAPNGDPQQQADA
jgi:AcrR family transcriptional regulator